MKNRILIFLLLFAGSPFIAMSQQVFYPTGVWKGEIYNDSTQKYIPFELAISRSNGELWGYTYTVFTIDSIENIGVKQVEIKIRDSTFIIRDKKLIDDNYTERPAKGVYTTLELAHTQNDTSDLLSGRWFTNKTKLYYPLSGTVWLQKKRLYNLTKIVPKLRQLGLAQKLSFYSEGNYDLTSVPDKQKQPRNNSEVKKDSSNEEEMITIIEPEMIIRIPPKDSSKNVALPDAQSLKDILKQADSTAGKEKPEQGKMEVIAKNEEQAKKEVALKNEGTRKQEARVRNDGMEGKEIPEKNKRLKNENERKQKDSTNPKILPERYNLSRLSAPADTTEKGQTVKNSLRGKEEVSDKETIAKNNLSALSVAGEEPSKISGEKNTSGSDKTAKNLSRRNAVKAQSEELKTGSPTQKEKLTDTIVPEDKIEKIRNDIQTTNGLLSGMITTSQDEKNLKLTEPDVLLPVPADLLKREIETIRSVRVLNDSIVLSLYDNGAIDGDTVSVILNDRVIMSRVGLLAKATNHTVYLTPDMGDSIKIVLYAENLGSIPPNTGLLIIRDGQKNHEIRFSGDLKRNSAIILLRNKEQ